MVQAFAQNGANHPLDIGSLPGRSRGRRHLLNLHVLDLTAEVVAEDLVAILQQLSWYLIEGKPPPQLMRGPFRRRMVSHVKADHATPFMSQLQKQVKHPEADGGNGEEVHRDQGPDVTVQEATSSLGGRFPMPDHVLGRAGLTDGDAQLEPMVSNYSALDRSAAHVLPTRTQLHVL